MIIILMNAWGMYAMECLMKKSYRTMPRDFFKDYFHGAGDLFLGVARFDSSINCDGHVDEKLASKFPDSKSSSL